MTYAFKLGMIASNEVPRMIITKSHFVQLFLVLILRQVHRHGFYNTEIPAFQDSMSQNNRLRINCETNPQ